MGYAHARNGQLAFEWEHIYNADIQDFIIQLKDQTHRIHFNYAHDRALQHTPIVDLGLINGYLESKLCANILWDLTGDPGCTNGSYWAAGYVKMAFETTDWKIEAHVRDSFIMKELTQEGKYKLWAYWSVYYFMKTCVENDLGIQFESL